MGLVLSERRHRRGERSRETVFNKNSFGGAGGIKSFDCVATESSAKMFFSRNSEGGQGKERWFGGRDNFQTLKMISGQNAAGQGLKWPVGSERGLKRPGWGKVGV